MNYKSTILTLLFALFLSFSSIFAQNAFDTPHLNRSVKKHFTAEVLKNLETQDFNKFNQLKYYFTNSFDVKLVGCPTCAIDYDEFFNIELFNIVDFENLRLENTDYTFLFNDGKYQITLYSYNIIVANMQGLTPLEVLKLKVYRPMPGWVATGDDNLDYLNYKKELDSWARDFTDEFRQITKSDNIVKITIAEFLSYPQNKQNTIVANGNYLLID